MQPIPHAWRRPGVVLAIASAACATACSPALDWRDTRFPEAGGALALFPCKPDRVSRRLPFAGAPVDFGLASCTAGGLTFAFGHLELGPSDADEAIRVASGLQTLQDAAVGNIGGSVRGLPALRVAGVADPARHVALQGRRPDGSVLAEEAVFFAHGRRLFQASVVGAAIDRETADTFFSGLKLPR